MTSQHTADAQEALGPPSSARLFPLHQIAPSPRSPCVVSTGGQQQDGTLEEDHRQGLGVGVGQAWDQGKESRGCRLEGEPVKKGTLHVVRGQRLKGHRGEAWVTHT